MKKLFKPAAIAAFATFLTTTGMQAQCPGALIVNEISKGTTPNGARQFVEFIAAGAAVAGQQCQASTVDISGWIIDDNNGLFSNTPAQAGVSISGGHYRLGTQDSLWKHFPKGALLVLFNAAAYDTTQSALFDAAVASTNGWSTDGTAFFVALGKSNLVQRNTTIPTASAPTSSLYCGRGTYTVAVDWSQAGLSGQCQGDGIQVRCPGCQTGLGEPSFYHGISYGNSMFHVASQGALDGAHISFPQGDTVCASTQDFYLNSAVNLADPGNDAAWSYGSAALATPGLPNTGTSSGPNFDFIDQITNNPAYTYSVCAAPVIVEGAGPAALMLTELSNGPSGSCEYAEILVANGGSGNSANVDVRGWIIDDNSGNFNTTGCASGAGIGSGHYRLAFDATWAQVPVGSFIVVYNLGTAAAPENCYNLPVAFKDSVYSDGHHVYYLPISGNGTAAAGTAHIEKITNLPSTSNCDYCTSIPGAYTAAANWPTIVGLGNSADAFQVRCPGCNDVSTAQPTFYHGFGYGAAPFASIAKTSGINLGGPVQATTGGASTFEFTGNDTTALASATTGWTKTAASTAGSQPATLGRISSTTFYGAVTNHALTLPLCAGSSASAKLGQATSINDIDASEGIRVYPNPATESINIEVPASQGTVLVKLMDINGRIVASKELTNETSVKFSVSDLTPGIYLYQVTSDTQVKSGKIDRKSVV